MSYRREHVKSRLGCKQCKKRKVKCDQGSPACSACIRRQEDCSLTLVNMHLIQQRSLLPVGEKSPCASSSRSSQMDNIDQEMEKPSYTSLDLELIHHYAATTFDTIMFQPGLAKVWRDRIFDISSDYSTLRTSLLVTAAMHKIVAVPNHPKRQQYIATVAKHKNEMIPFLIGMLKSPSPENCIALFSSSILLTIWGFAARSLPPELDGLAVFAPATNEVFPNESPSRDGCVLDDFLKIVNVSQGVFAVAEQVGTWLEAKGLEPLSPSHTTLPPAPGDLDMAIDFLDEHLQAYHLDNNDDERLVTLIAQTARMRWLFRVRQCPEWFDMIVGWATQLSKTMVLLLERRDPGALTILAYWASCLYALDDRWWINGWSRALFTEVSESLAAPWKEHLIFPAAMFDRRLV